MVVLDKEERSAVLSCSLLTEHSAVEEAVACLGLLAELRCVSLSAEANMNFTPLSKRFSS